MLRMLISSFATVLLAVTFATSAIAQDLTPVGQWRLNTGQSHYDIVFCGDGTQLCATVIWLGPETLDEKTAPSLNKMIVDQARRTGDHRWRGIAKVYGLEVTGIVEQVSENEMKVTGCKFIFCKSFKLLRL